MLRSAGPQHYTASMGLMMALMRDRRSDDRGAFWRLLAVALGDHSLVIPDLVYVSRERRHLIEEFGVRGAPDMIAEVVSPRSAIIDRVHKRDLYARHRVRNYWIVEPLDQTIRAYALSVDGLYELVAEAHGNQTFAAPPFADLQIDLAALWADPFAR